MSKIKLTKGELKRQRDSLQQYEHYLPTLQLKKQQLQAKILEVKRGLAEREKLLDEKKQFIEQWSGLLADVRFEIRPWVIPVQVVKEDVNIAGVRLPLCKSIQYKDIDYDFYATPFWTDQAIERMRDFFNILIEVNLIKRQIDILAQELRIITQRVNLFEKVKIPECMDHIRKIRIYLGDQQASAVGISKVAKKKIESLSVVG